MSVREVKDKALRTVRELDTVLYKNLPFFFTSSNRPVPYRVIQKSTGNISRNSNVCKQFLLSTFARIHRLQESARTVATERRTETTRPWTTPAPSTTTARTDSSPSELATPTRSSTPGPASAVRILPACAFP